MALADQRGFADAPGQVGIQHGLIGAGELLHGEHQPPAIDARHPGKLCQQVCLQQVHGRVAVELAHQHYVGIPDLVHRLGEAEGPVVRPLAKLVVIEGLGRLALRRGGAGGQQQGQGEQGESSSHGISLTEAEIGKGTAPYDGSMASRKKEALV